MGALSDYLENKLLDHSLGTAPYTQPAAIYVALFTTAPTDAGGGTEVSGGGYSRKQVTFSAAVNGQASNSTDILFDVATANWGTITHAALFDASTGGNMLWWGALNASVQINTNDQFKFAAGNLTASLD